MLKQLEVELGTGYAAAGCRSCGKVFTSISAFDKHQRLARGAVVCLNPAYVGLERKPNGRWGQKADSRQKARVARFNDGVSRSRPSLDVLVSSGGQAC